MTHQLDACERSAAASDGRDASDGAALSPFKWLSVALTGLGAPLMLGFAWLIASPAWKGTLSGSLALCLTAVLLGLMPGFAVWFLSARQDAELSQLESRLQRFDPSRDAAVNLNAGLGLKGLGDAAGDVIQQLRQQVNDQSSQRRELEVQLRVCEGERRHLTAILNAISDGVIVTDAFNEVVLANEAAAQLMGFDVQRIARRPVDQVLPDPSLAKLIKDTREGGDPSLRRHVEHEVEHNGQTVVYDVTLACVPAEAAQDARGEGQAHVRGDRGCAGIVMVLRDITREKEIAEMKSDFVSNVSHELRTPLSSIKAYMEMLVDGEAHDEETRREFYNIVQGETNRLSRLIDNILNISRIETGVVKVNREYVSLKELIVEAIDVMQPQAQAKQIELKEDGAPVCCQVFADRDMLLQALLNLVGNAIKYTPAQGRVSINLDMDEHARTATVGVTDTGKGIPADDLPHLFDKFYRVADHKKMAKGTGLGLNLVKHVIETIHEGDVGVTSEIDQGSTFTFTLPIAENK